MVNCKPFHVSLLSCRQWDALTPDCEWTGYGRLPARADSASAAVVIARRGWWCMAWCLMALIHTKRVVTAADAA